MKSLIIALLLSSSSGVKLDKLDNQELLEKLMSEGHHIHHHHIHSSETHIYTDSHVHHYHHTRVNPPSVKQITNKMLAKKLDKACVKPRKEEQILREAIKAVVKIKDETPVPTPMSVPKGPSQFKPRVIIGEPDEPEVPEEVIENPLVPGASKENKVIEVDKPETTADVDNRSVVQKAFDRAEEKLTFKDWQDNQNQKELKEYIKNPAKYTQSEDADEIADEKHEQKEKQKDLDVKLQKKILKKVEKSIDKAEKADLKQEKKTLFEEARDAPDAITRKTIIDTAAKLVTTEAQSVPEALEKGKDKIAAAIKATSLDVDADASKKAEKEAEKDPETPVSRAQISADEFVYSDKMQISDKEEPEDVKVKIISDEVAKATEALIPMMAGKGDDSVIKPYTHGPGYTKWGREISPAKKGYAVMWHAHEHE